MGTCDNGGIGHRTHANSIQQGPEKSKENVWEASSNLGTLGDGILLVEREETLFMISRLSESAPINEFVP